MGQKSGPESKGVAGKKRGAGGEGREEGGPADLLVALWLCFLREDRTTTALQEEMPEGEGKTGTGEKGRDQR